VVQIFNHYKRMIRLPLQTGLWAFPLLLLSLPVSLSSVRTCACSRLLAPKFSPVLWDLALQWHLLSK
jgi:hypothetical protein